MALPLLAQLLNPLLQLLQRQTCLSLAQFTRYQLILEMSHRIIWCCLTHRFLVLLQFLHFGL